jgi:hypothetical protein
MDTGSIKDELFTLSIRKGASLRRVINSNRIKIYDIDGNTVFNEKLFFKRELTVLLPKDTYTIEVSCMGGVLGKEVKSQLLLDDFSGSDCCVVIDIINRNYLISMVPFLGYFTTPFDYSLHFDNRTEDSPHIQYKNNAVYRTLSVIFASLALLFITISLSMFFPGSELGFTGGNESFIDEHLFIEGTDGYTEATYEYKGYLIGDVILWALNFSLSIVFLRISRSLKLKSRRRNIVNSSNAEMHKPYSLYLRSFNSDKLTSKELSSVLKPGQTEESMLVDIFNQIAPVCAIGRPNEVYIPKGADRIYVDDSEWKDKVTQLAAEAEVIILRLGETEGFWWEVDHCFHSIDIKKLLFVIPATHLVDTISLLYGRMLSSGMIDKPMKVDVSKKSKTSIAGFIYFDDNNQPVFKKFKVNKPASIFVPLNDFIEQLLGDFLSRLKLVVKQKRLAMRAVLGWVLAVSCLCLLSAGKYFTYLDFQQNRYPKDIIRISESNSTLDRQLDGYNDSSKIRLILESAELGVSLLNEDEALDFFSMTYDIVNTISAREAELLVDQIFAEDPGLNTNLLILAKKYLYPEYYERYINYISKCSLLYFENSAEAVASYGLSEDVFDEFIMLIYEYAPAWYETENPTQKDKQEFLPGYYTAAAHMYIENSERIDVIRNALVIP